MANQQQHQQQEEGGEERLSVGQFLAVSAAAVGGGVIYGVRRHLRSQQFALHMRLHASPIAVASQALLYGTLLCASCFGLGAGIVSITSGIYSFRQLGTTLREKLRPYKGYQARKEDEEYGDREDELDAEFNALFSEIEDAEEELSPSEASEVNEGIHIIAGESSHPVVTTGSNSTSKSSHNDR